MTKKKEQELFRAIHEIVLDKTRKYDAVLEVILDDFVEIKRRIDEELDYPNEKKKTLVERIRQLNEHITDFLKKE